MSKLHPLLAESLLEVTEELSCLSGGTEPTTGSTIIFWSPCHQSWHPLLCTAQRKELSNLFSPGITMLDDPQLNKLDSVVASSSHLSNIKRRTHIRMFPLLAAVSRLNCGYMSCGAPP
jgi:hypothetical protein